MKRLVTTALATALIAAPTFAQMDGENAELIRTRDITGGEIYSMNAETYDESMWDGAEVFEEIDDNWTDIGEIEDIVLDRSGKMTGIVGEIGGFLDVGDKHVMLPVDDIKLIAVDDDTYAYVTRRTEEQLEEMESVDESAMN